MASLKPICTCCGKPRSLGDYYASPSPFHKHTSKLHVCKPCIWNEAEGITETNIGKAKDILRRLDRPFLTNIWQSSIEESESGTKDLFKSYMKNIGMPQYRDLSWSDSLAGNTSSNEVDNGDTQPTGDVYSDEQKIYSKKWVGHYTPSDIEYLENYIKGLHADFKVVTENHKDYARKIAKASLYMDKCFQDMQNGISGSEKKYKDAKDIFDTLSKSAQFSESQRGQNDVGLGSFGKVFELVEASTYIPEHIPINKDDIEKMISDFAHISKSV